jgi:6-phosphogluconolactonase
MSEPAVVFTIVAEDVQDLAEQASRLLLSLITEALKDRGDARVILSGGTTPRATYKLLASGISAQGIEIEKVSWFFGDERWVPHDDPQSNEGMALETLLWPIGAPAHTVHSWHAGSGDPVECARRYDAVVKAAMGTARTSPDILLLGIGPDGHTASLFPGAVAHLPDGRQVLVAPDICGSNTAPQGLSLPVAAAAVQGGAARGWRLTLCPDLLRTSRSVIFLAEGADKTTALRRARKGDPGTPAAWIRGRKTYFIATRDAMGPEQPDYGRDIRNA